MGFKAPQAATEQRPSLYVIPTHEEQARGANHRPSALLQVGGRRTTHNATGEDIRRDTVDACYYDTASIRKCYQYIQTIDITSKNFCCFVMNKIQTSGEGLCRSVAMPNPFVY